MLNQLSDQTSTCCVPGIVVMTPYMRITHGTIQPWCSRAMVLYDHGAL